MFFPFANWNNLEPLSNPVTLSSIEKLTALHPQVLLCALEDFYSRRTLPVLITPDFRLPLGLVANYGGAAPNLQSGISAAPTNMSWDHLIYSYMIENTRIFEIFDRVLREYEGGERFETPTPEAALWLRTTEALFYSDVGSGMIGSLTSTLRGDIRATFRNAYYRMLGLDLNHGLDGKRPYQFDKPYAANRDFVPTFEAFAREVWRGAINASNSSGANETDDATIADHARRLREMLNVRRQNGNLIREEFWATVTMSWFHLAVAQDTPIVKALKAEAESPADRLKKIGERVGVPAHSRSDAYFNMAQDLSQILQFVERDPMAVNPAAAKGYYDPTGPFPLMASSMKNIIAQWSIATGRDLKGQRSAAPLPKPTERTLTPPVRRDTGVLVSASPVR